MLNLLSCTMVYESIIPRHKVSLCKLAVLCTHHREVRLNHTRDAAQLQRRDGVLEIEVGVSPASISKMA